MIFFCDTFSTFSARLKAADKKWRDLIIITGPTAVTQHDGGRGRNNDIRRRRTAVDRGEAEGNLLLLLLLEKETDNDKKSLRHAPRDAAALGVRCCDWVHTLPNSVACTANRAVSHQTERTSDCGSPFAPLAHGCGCWVRKCCAWRHLLLRALRPREDADLLAAYSCLDSMGIHCDER